MKITDQDINKKMYSGKSIKEIIKIDNRSSLNTGISSIDNNFGFPCGYYIVVGNPGVGKSWFALWLSRMFYRHNGMYSVYFSLEMPEQLVRQRILQQWSDFTKAELESGKYPDEAIELLGKDVIVVDEFYADDTSKQTPDAFESWVGEYYRLGYRVFHLDHFHELQGASVNNTNQETVEKWGLCFQQICKKYPDIWLIVFAQPNSQEKTVLRRNSLLGSKALTYKCDYFLSLNTNVDDESIDSETKIVANDIVLYLDKTRYTEKNHIGFLLTRLSTGNFARRAKND